MQRNVLPIKKQSVWPVFLLVFLSSTAFVIFLVVNSYNSMLDSVVSIQKSRVLLLSNEIKNKLKSHESYIDVSIQALEYDAVKRADDYLEKKIYDLINTSETLLSVTVYNKFGDIILSSETISPQLPSNVLDQVLSSSELILGRSYIYRNQGLVMPLYKPIKFDNETFILSFVISVESVFDPPTDIYNIEGIDSLIIWRDTDRYFQFVGPNNIDHQIYDTPAEESLVNKQLERLERQTGKLIDTLKSEGVPIVNSINTNLRGTFTTSIFIPDYKIWLTLESSEDKFNKKFINITARYFYIYLFFILVLILIFNYIKIKIKDHEDKTKYLINHDYLTGLKNIVYLNHLLIDKVSGGHQVNIALFYIENLPTINGLLGHTVGDQVIVKVSKVLSTYNNREGTIAFRVAGNEFALYSELTSLEIISNEITLLFSKPVRCEGHYVSIDIRVGKFFSDSNDFTPGEIKRNVNLALDKAIESNLKSYTYDPKLLEDFIYKNTLKEELRYAIKREELYVCYQPKLNFERKVYSLEALLRWKNSKLGHIPPDVFIPLAESTGLIHELGEFVLETVIKDRKKLTSIYTYTPNVALNVSLLQMWEKSFILNLKKLIENYQVERGSLTIELTESILMNNIDQIIKVMKEMRELGVKISLDDFGSGFSSLNVLARLPIDEVKLDRVFICNISDNDSENILLTIKNIISLCMDLSLEVVVEGIEDEDTETVLKKLGAQNFQGYFYSKPVRISDLG